MKNLYRFLIALHIIVGLGAIGGGLLAILNPLKPLGMSVEVLKNSPFDNFLIPGILLFTVIGIGNITSALIIGFKLRFHEYVTNVFSWALVIWIIVQVIMLNTVHYLHMIFFGIGVIQVALATTVLFEHRLFPANIVVDFYKKISKEI